MVHIFVNIGLGDGLVPNRHQTITQTIADLFAIVPSAIVQNSVKFYS